MSIAANKSIIYFFDDPSFFDVVLSDAITTISMQMFFPVTENYSINCILNQTSASPVLAIDGKSLDVTITNNSVYSAPIYLMSGYHKITLTVGAPNSPQCIIINNEFRRNQMRRTNNKKCNNLWKYEI